MFDKVKKILICFFVSFMTFSANVFAINQSDKIGATVSVNELGNSDNDSVYYGTYNGNPILWDVVSEESGVVTLITSDILLNMQFDSSYTVTDEFSATFWQESEICDFLNSSTGFYGNSFSTIEKNGIVDEYSTVEEYPFGGTTPFIANQKIVIPSLDEVRTWYDNDAERISQLAGTDSNWFTRTQSGIIFTSYYTLGAVSSDGSVQNVGAVAEASIGVRPVFKLDLGYTILASDADDDGAISTNLKSISSVTGPRKLTQFDGTYSSGTVSGYSYTSSNNVKIEVSNATPSKTVTALVKNNSDEIVYYGNIGTTDTSGNASICAALPVEIDGTNYNLEVFVGDENGAYNTNYGSEPVVVSVNEINDLIVDLAEAPNAINLFPQAIDPGYTYYYAYSTTEKTPVCYNSELPTTGWTTFSSLVSIPETTGQVLYVQVIKVEDATGKVKNWGQASSLSAILEYLSVALETGIEKITIFPFTEEAGYKYYYQINDSSQPEPTVNDQLPLTGWVEYNSNVEIPETTGDTKYIQVVKVKDDSTRYIKAWGEAAATATVLHNLTVEAISGVEQVTLLPQTPKAGYEYYYKTSLSSSSAPIVDTDITTLSGWTKYDANYVMNDESGDLIYFQVIEVETSTNKIKAWGEAAVAASVLRDLNVQLTTGIELITLASQAPNIDYDYYYKISDTSSTAPIVDTDITTLSGWTVYDSDYSLIETTGTEKFFQVVKVEKSTNKIKAWGQASAIAFVMENLTVELTSNINAIDLSAQAPKTGYTYYYKISNSSSISPDVNENFDSTGWTSYSSQYSHVDTSGDLFYFQVVKVEDSTNMIKGWGEAAATAIVLGNINVSLTTGIEQITLHKQIIESGYDYYYLVSDSSSTSPIVDTDITTLTGWTIYDNDFVLSEKTGTEKFFQVVKVETSTNKIKAWGQSSAVASVLRYLNVSLSTGVEKITLHEQTPDIGFDYYYKVSNDPSSAPIVDSIVDAQWIKYNSNVDIPDITGTLKHIQVIKVEASSSKIKAWGQSSATASVLKYLDVVLKTGPEKITLYPQNPVPGYTYYYKVLDTSSNEFIVDTIFDSTGWTEYSSEYEMDETTGEVQYFQVVQVKNDTNEIKAWGQASARASILELIPVVLDTGLGEITFKHYEPITGYKYYYIISDSQGISPIVDTLITDDWKEITADIKIPNYDGSLVYVQAVRVEVATGKIKAWGEASAAATPGYILTVVLDGGDGTEINQIYGVDQNVQIDAGKKSGYKFNKWISSNGGSFENEKNSNTIFKMPANSTTVTALWTKIVVVDNNPPTNSTSEKSQDNKEIKYIISNNDNNDDNEKTDIIDKDNTDDNSNLIDGDNNNPTNIEETEHLKKTSIFNFIFVLISILFAILGLIKKDRIDVGKFIGLKIGLVIVAVFAIILYILTQEFVFNFILFDGWTILFSCLSISSIVLYYLLQNTKAHIH